MNAIYDYIGLSFGNVLSQGKLLAMVLSQVGSWAPKCHAVQGAANFGRALS